MHDVLFNDDKKHNNKVNTMNRRTKFSLYSLLLLGFVAIVNLLFLGGRLDYTTTTTTTTNNNNNNNKNHRYNLSSSTQTSLITPTRSNSTSSNETHDDNYGDDTTIIITSNFIPSHPSTELIDETIESISKYIHGLNKIENNTTPIIITIDGAYKKYRGPNATKTKILHDYTQRLYEKYGNNNNIKILTSKTNIMLVGNVQKAIRHVQTEFVYIIQHDMPFITTINHNLLLQAFQNHPKQIRLVRFSPLKTLIRNRDKGICNNKTTTEDEVEIEFYDDDDNNNSSSSIHLSKTHTWSDGNHFTRKSYYDEIFTTIQGWENTRYMEEKMKVLGKQNCSYWGTYLYGSIGDEPTIIHRDGRRYYGTGGDDDGEDGDDDGGGAGQSQQQQQQQSFVSELMQIHSLRRKY